MKKIIWLSVILMLNGCATIQPAERSRLTVGMVKKEIIKGVTIQNEVLKAFGAPNIITKNKSGNEVWTYDKLSVERGISDRHGTLIIVGAASSRRFTSTRTFTLMIEFDDNGVVKEYSYRSSAF